MAATSNRDKMLIGATVAALAAGAFFFRTTEGKKNAKKFKGWMVRMKGEVLEKLEDMEEVTEPVYREIVDTVANAQMVANKIPRSEILTLATDLKRQWNSIKRMAGVSTQKRHVAKKSATKSVVKKSAKKVNKKK